VNIKAFVFDAYGTLFDVHAAVRRHADAVGADHEKISALWRAKQLEYSWVRTLMDRYVDFWRCSEDALVFALRSHARYDAQLVRQLLSSYRVLEAYPDAAPTLTALRAAGFSTAILSNGSPAMLDAAVSSADLRGLVDRVISVDAVRRYKTHPSTYALVLQTLGLERAEISFQSANAWDIAGASAFGFRCVHVNRTGSPAEYADVSRCVEVDGLVGLLALPAI
jgi:2-haloacid dehalogenase